MTDALGEPVQSVRTGRPVSGRDYRLRREMLRNELSTCHLDTELVSLFELADNQQAAVISRQDPQTTSRLCSGGRHDGCRPEMLRQFVRARLPGT